MVKKIVMNNQKLCARVAMYHYVMSTFHSGIVVNSAEVTLRKYDART